MTARDKAQQKEDVMMDLYKIHAYIPNDAVNNPLTPFGNFCCGYEAAKAASEKEIAELKEQVSWYNEWLSNGVYFTTDEAKDLHDGYKAIIADHTKEIARRQQIAVKHAKYEEEADERNEQLQAENQRLREALYAIRNEELYPSLHKIIADKALATPAQSLKEHDESTD